MSPQSDLIESLTVLNQVAQSLNQAVDVRSVLDTALAQLIQLMGMETGWIVLKDAVSHSVTTDQGYELAAHHNLPPALVLDNRDAWDGACECQNLCNTGKLTKAHNMVHCSRLARASGDRRGLAVHATTPLLASDRSLGILNVAGRDWDAFSPEALSMLTNVGSQMGTALERARLFDLLRDQRVDEQKMLLDLSNRLLSQLNTDDLMDRLVEETERLLGADACALFLLGEEPGFLELRATSGWSLESLAGSQRVEAHQLSGLGSVLHTRQPLLIEDVHASSPPPQVPDWLRATGYRGLAVAPLVTEDRSVGALVLGARQPRALNADEVRLLCLLANQATIAIENARLHEQEIQQQRLESELAVGQKIQLSLLPESCPDLPGWECAAYYQAARQVGGDFYDIFELPGKPGQVGMVIADVADKGVPAALFMAVSRTMIRAAALTSSGPAATLMQANELMLQGNRSELFVSAVYVVLDTGSGQLVYANAGHNPPLWLQAATGVLRELTAPGTVLGAFEGIKLEERAVQMAPGDQLLFFTDGVTEAMDGNDQEFGEMRLREAAAANLTGNASQVLEAVVDAVQTFTDSAPQSDDLTLFVVRRTPVSV